MPVFGKVKSEQSYPTHYITDIKNYCIKIAPYVDYYKKSIDYYNWTAYEIITNELALILPTFPKQKRGIITSLITDYMGLAYEDISSFLHYKRQKALNKQFSLWIIKWIYNAIVFYLEDSMVMYGIYNSDTLETLTDTVHRLYNQTTWNEKLFAGKIEDWYHWYLSEKGVGHYAINSIAIPYHGNRKICQNV